MKYFVLVTAATIALSGCSKDWMYEDTMIVTQQPIVAEVTSDQDRFPHLNLNDSTLFAMAEKYDALSDPMMQMSVLYDPKQEAKVAKEVAQLQNRLKAIGVDNIHVEKMPVQDLDAQLLVSYEGLEVMEAPECAGNYIPGMKDNDPGNDRDYLLGCSMQRQMLAQIADPKDAMGQAGLSGGMAGTKAVNVVNGYNDSGDPVDFVPGYLLSDIGQGSN